MNWQPIETAPKDGTHILIFDYSGTISVVAWNGYAQSWEEPQSNEIYFDGATHWIPLPAPPE